jgi:hypothetical protein
MELLSIGKEPEEFYQLIKNLLAKNPCPPLHDGADH